MRKLSIGVRLTLWYVAIFALGEIVFGAGMWFILRHNLYDLVDDELGKPDRRSEEGSSKHKRRTPRSPKLQEEVSESYGIEHAGDFLEIYVETGDLIYRSSFSTGAPVDLDAARSGQPTAVPNPSRRRTALPFCLPEAQRERPCLHRGNGQSPADDAVETLQLFRTYLLMFAPLLLLVAALVGYWMSRRALSPVDALVRTAREVSGTNLNSRLQKLEDWG